MNAATNPLRPDHCVNKKKKRFYGRPCLQMMAMIVVLLGVSGVSYASPTTPAHNADYYIQKLDLKPLEPEGGYFRQFYISKGEIGAAALPKRYDGGSRHFSTAIYFLLKGKQVSNLHKMKTDEVWHHYAGGPLIIHIFYPDGHHDKITLGSDLDSGMQPAAVAPRGTWFGAELPDDTSFALVGTTVAPGYTQADFTLGQRQALEDKFPEYTAIIKRLTPPARQ